MVNQYSNEVLTDDGLEAIADNLLRDNNALGRRSGCYTTTALERQRTDRGETSLEEDRARETYTSGYDGIVWRSIQQSLHRANCPYIAQECMRLWCMRFTYREIGELPHVNLSHHTVGYWIRKCVIILRQDKTLGIVEMLAEVFHIPPSTVTYLLAEGTGGEEL